MIKHDGNLPSGERWTKQSKLGHKGMTNILISEIYKKYRYK